MIKVVKLINFLTKNFCSQRDAKKYINSKEISVNGNSIKWDDEIDPKSDVVKFKKKRIYDNDEIFLALNKPKGYTITAKSNKFERSIYEIIREKRRVIPVGRLDKMTEGLILFTNNGELADRLMNPKYKIERTYVVYIIGDLTRMDIQKMRKGVMIGEYLAKPVRVGVVDRQFRGKKPITEVKIILREGKNREVRRLFEHVNKKIIKLERIKFGPVKLGGLKRGNHRNLSQKEIDSLKRKVKLD